MCVASHRIHLESADRLQTVGNDSTSLKLLYGSTKAMLVELIYKDSECPSAGRLSFSRKGNMAFPHS